MKTDVEELSPTRVKLTVEVPFDEFEPNVKAAYKKIAKQVHLKGFRPGKAPTRLIDQYVGREAVLQEAFQDSMQELYGRALSESGITPLGQAELDEPEIEDGRHIGFVAEVDVRPKLELPDFESLDVTVDDAEVADEDIDEEISKLRDRFASLTGVDRSAGTGDFVSIDLTAEIDGEELEDQKASGVSLEVGAGAVLEGLDEALTGLSAGESETFRTTLVGGERAGEEADATVTVHSVKEKQLPDLDDDFAQMASEFDTLEELREDTRAKVARDKLMDQAVQARDRAVEALVDSIEIPVPEKVLEHELEHRKESLDQEIQRLGLDRDTFFRVQEKTEEEAIAEIEEDAKKALKTSFVLDTVVERDEVQVDQDDLTRYVVQQAAQMGVEPQMLAQYLQQNNQLPQIVSEVRRAKAMTEIAEHVKIKDSSGNEVDLKVLQDKISEQEASDDSGETVDGPEDVAAPDEAPAHPADEPADEAPAQPTDEPTDEPAGESAEK